MSIAIHSPCWAQAFRPSVTTAIMRLGRRLELDLAIPKGQTCCGLPAWEAGQRDAALGAARRTVRIFRDYEQVVTSSPACLRMMREHIPALLRDHPEAKAARALSEHSGGWCDFLAHNVGADRLDLHFEGKIAYYPPCQQEDDAAIRRLLAGIRHATLLPDPTHQCCGFGNNLALRHPELSQAIAGPVVGAMRLVQADLIVTNDVGCLLHLRPLLQTAGAPPILHLAEFLDQIADVGAAGRSPLPSSDP